MDIFLKINSANLKTNYEIHFITVSRSVQWTRKIKPYKRGDHTYRTMLHSVNTCGISEN